MHSDDSFCLDDEDIESVYERQLKIQNAGFKRSGFARKYKSVDETPEMKLIKST